MVGDCPRICLIMPFYGKWPPYFNLYLKSCEINKFIDFIFFTDIAPPLAFPSNVKFIKLPLEELNSKINGKLSITSKIINPYKLCDFKPLYGFIFQEYLTNYNFWGHGDIDLIYGNIQNFVTNNVLQENDVISFRKEWISGCFALFRNVNLVNHLFKESKNYLSILNAEQYIGFDECSKLWADIRNKDILEIDTLQSMTFIVKRAVREGRLRAYFETCIKESIEPKTKILWDNGSIIHYPNQKKYLLYHFITEKRTFSFTYPSWNVIPNKFYIANTGFYTREEFLGKGFALSEIYRRIRGFFKYIPSLSNRVFKKIKNKLCRMI